MSRKQDEKRSGRWFRRCGEGFLKRVGVRACSCVADLGCHDGRFTLPAARIVGDCGVVYAVDRNAEVLKTLKRSARKEALGNVRLVRADLSRSRAARIPDGAVDIALLYDMLHRGYLPNEKDRRATLEHVARILKPGGILSCYFTHLNSYRWTFREALGEVRNAGFVLQGEARRRLVHDGQLVRGRIFRFRKSRR